MSDSVTCSVCGKTTQGDLEGWVFVSADQCTISEQPWPGAPPSHFCPECAAKVEREQAKDIDELLKAFGKRATIEDTEIIQLRKALVESAGQQALRRVLRLDYGWLWVAEQDFDVDAWYGIYPTLRDHEGRGAEVRIEIMEGTTKRTAICHLMDAACSLALDYESKVDWDPAPKNEIPWVLYNPTERSEIG